MDSLVVSELLGQHEGLRLLSPYAAVVSMVWIAPLRHASARRPWRKATASLRVLAEFLIAPAGGERQFAAAAGEPLDLLRLAVGRDLTDANEAEAEAGQGRRQIALIEALKGCGNDGAANDSQRPRSGQVVGDREGRRQVALVFHQRKGRIDDMQMRVEAPVDSCFHGPALARRRGVRRDRRLASCG